MSDMQNAPTWPLVTVVHLRAASAGEAVDIEEVNLRVAAEMDTGEAGHSAGGVVVGVLNDGIETIEGLTMNQSLQEAALLLLAASYQEGDDGTGGVQTLKELEDAREIVTGVIRELKEAQG